jgi:chitodextrinase
LFSRINAPGEIPAWVAGQSYAKDVQVTHDGKTWLSVVDNNVWEPGAAGVFDSIWREVVE